MKKILLLTALLLVSANAVSFSWIESKWKSGGTIPSTLNEVDAAGWDFRSYSYLDAAGRACTAVFTDKKMALDCDFFPSEKAKEQFINRLK